MPELPEVETTRRGISATVTDNRIRRVDVWQPRLRYPVPADLAQTLRGQTVTAIERRGKYLLLRLQRGTLLVHLGMSGSLRVVTADVPRRTHDHIQIEFADGRCLRYHDPRRFGIVTWWDGHGLDHPLLESLGVEPLSEDFNGEYLASRARGRRCAVKLLIMDAQVVVGVGNIYANEALFMAGISPRRAAGRVSRSRYDALAASIKTVLENAITVGGTTLRDFVGGDGQPGYFKQSLLVYDRAGEPCRRCSTPIRLIRLGQRSTYYCPHCQH